MHGDILGFFLMSGGCGGEENVTMWLYSDALFVPPMSCVIRLKGSAVSAVGKKRTLQGIHDVVEWSDNLC